MSTVNGLPTGGGTKGSLITGDVNTVLVASYASRASRAGYIWVWNPDYIEVTAGLGTGTITFTAKKTCTLTILGGQYYGHCYFANVKVNNEGTATASLTKGQSYTATNYLERTGDTNYGVFTVTE